MCGEIWKIIFYETFTSSPKNEKQEIKAWMLIKSSVEFYRARKRGVSNFNSVRNHGYMRAFAHFPSSVTRILAGEWNQSFPRHVTSVW